MSQPEEALLSLESQGEVNGTNGVIELCCSNPAFELGSAVSLPLFAKKKETKGLCESVCLGPTCAIHSFFNHVLKVGEIVLSCSTSQASDE